MAATGAGSAHAQERFFDQTALFLEMPRIPGQRFLAGTTGTFQQAGRQWGSWEVLSNVETGLHATSLAQPNKPGTGPAIGEFASAQALFSRLSGRNNGGLRLDVHGQHFPRVPSRNKAEFFSRTGARLFIDSRHLLHMSGAWSRRQLDVSALPPDPAGPVVSNQGKLRAVLERQDPPYTAALGVRANYQKIRSELDTPAVNFDESARTGFGLEGRAGYSWRRGYTAFVTGTIETPEGVTPPPLLVTAGVGVGTSIPQLARGAAVVFLDRSDDGDRTRIGPGFAATLQYKLSPLSHVFGLAIARPESRVGPFDRQTFAMEIGTNYRPWSDLTFELVGEVEANTDVDPVSWRWGQNGSVIYNVSRLFSARAQLGIHSGRSQTTNRKYVETTGRFSINLQF